MSKNLDRRASAKREMVRVSEQRERSAYATKTPCVRRYRGARGAPERSSFEAYNKSELRESIERAAGARYGSHEKRSVAGGSHEKRSVTGLVRGAGCRLFTLRRGKRATEDKDAREPDESAAPEQGSS
ncbi:hypothetical protein VM1G_01975 [Cytospora mali]|uniref:Uncharacterized protein n=1 Tax=Cytospora mali TaxID=578113 RepID=A0A194VPZ0_CYTMA|nr:hypothetical protein VM1G_01975 [Valsa mali]